VERREERKEQTTIITFRHGEVCLVSAGAGFGGRSNRIEPMDERIVEKTE
jgi:hypothetical protein